MWSKLVTAGLSVVLWTSAAVPAGAEGPEKKSWWSATSWYFYGGTAGELEELHRRAAPPNVGERELVSTRIDFFPLAGIGGTYCVNDRFLVDFGLEHGRGTVEHGYEHSDGDFRSHALLEADAEAQSGYLLGRFYLRRPGRVRPWLAAGVVSSILRQEQRRIEIDGNPSDLRFDFDEVETTELRTGAGVDFELGGHVVLSLEGDYGDGLGWSTGLSLRYKVSPGGCCRNDARSTEEAPAGEVDQGDDETCGPFLPGEVPLPRIETPARTVRRPLRLDASALPAGSRAHLGAFDGDPFFLRWQRPQDQAVIVPTLQALGFRAGPEVLQASGGLQSRSQDLTALAEILENELAADPGSLGPTGPEIVEVLRGRAAPGAAVDAALKASLGLDYAELVADVTHPELLYVFQQVHDGVPIEHTLLLASGRPGRGVTSVRGTLIDDYDVVNRPTVTSPAAAANEAMKEVEGVQRVDLPAAGEGPVLVLLPYGSDEEGRILLRYAYRMILVARFCQQEVPFLLWLDAGDATLLKLEPLVSDVAGEKKDEKKTPVGARALIYSRDPGVGTQPAYVHVDPGEDGKYVLQSTGAMNRVDFQDDDFDELDVAVTLDAEEGTVSFDQYPINDTSQALCASGSNKQFQQVHFYASTMRYRRYSLALGVDPVFSLAWKPGVESPRAGCNALSNMSFGACTGYYDAKCPDYSDGTQSLENCMNFAHDSTVIAHEFGHNITDELTQRRPFDWCGRAECAIPVGWSALHDLADFWADHFESTNCVAGWTCKNVGGVDASLNCRSHSEAEGLPRLHELALPFDPDAPGDHFPEHRRLASGEYADMQIGTAALWQLQLATRSRSRAGGMLTFAARLSRALAKTGFLSETPPDTDLGIYRYLYDLETELTEEWASAAAGSVHATQDVVTSFARAGLFLIPPACLDADPSTSSPDVCPSGENGGDAVVDVDDNDPADDYTVRGVRQPETDFLRLGGPAPTFHVWTGPLYRFDGTGNALLAQPAPCNLRYRVDVSPDAAFPADRTVSSGWTEVERDPRASSPPACYGTWTPDAPAWTQLQTGGAGSRLYYRVTTRDEDGGDERASTEPGGGLWTIPPAYAVFTVNGKAP